MITRIRTTNEIAQEVAEIFLNNQSKVTKVSDESVLNAFFHGIAKVGQKAEKDIAIVESRLFPDSAYGAYLDDIATRLGVPARFGTSGSSTVLLVYANPGAQYLRATHTFNGDNGVQFIPTEDLTIGVNGFGYLKVRSVDTGVKTNINPLTINRVTPEPSGHQYVTNEFIAIGGRDEENDDQFRRRIKENANVVARSTAAFFVQLFQRINENVYDVIKEGVSNDGKLVLSLVAQNGMEFSQTELDELLEKSADYFSMTDLAQFGDNFGVELKNVEWYPIDVDIRIDLAQNIDPDTIRKNIQVAFNNYVDFTIWDYDKKVEWDDLLQLVKNIEGVRYVPDTYFNPSVDIKVPRVMIPRFRRFIMRDLEGNVITDVNGVLNPVFYQNKSL